MSERDLPPFVTYNPDEVTGDHPGNLDIFSDIIEVEGVDTTDHKKADQTVNDFLKNNPEIKEKAQSQGHDIVKRIRPKHAWILVGPLIAGVAAGIGAKVLYDHIKEKKRQKDEG